jgi:DNA-binding response OmpR family regulator
MTNIANDTPFLMGLDGSYQAKRWTLEKDEFVIGRSQGCDLIIGDRQVSRRHTRLKRDNQGHIVEDLGSKNGTFLNGIRIHEPKHLEDGDEIQIALAVKLAYLGSEATVQLSMPSEEGRLWMDMMGSRVFIHEKELNPPLSAAQYRLLELLYKNAGRVVSRDEIIAYVWEGTSAEGVSEQAIDALVRRLRDRLAEVDDDHVYVVTVRGRGLRLENQE